MEKFKPHSEVYLKNLQTKNIYRIKLLEEADMKQIIYQCYYAALSAEKEEAASGFYEITVDNRHKALFQIDDYKITYCALMGMMLKEGFTYVPIVYHPENATTTLFRKLETGVETEN